MAAKRRRGLILAAGLALVALAGIAFIIARPARILGVKSGSLGDSLVYEFDADSGKCQKLEGARLDETAWRCELFVVPPGGSGQLGASYSVRADDWGCWDAERVESAGAGARLADTDSACIILFDYIHILDK